MAVTYSGNTPRFSGRSTGDYEHPYKGAGTYSNWSIFHGDGPLSVFPANEENHVPGTGRHPHNVQMSRYYTGLEDRTQPLDDPGMGPELTWHRKYSDVITIQGEGAQKAFGVDYGHEDRVTSYSRWAEYIYRGVTPAPLADPGHEFRRLNEGTANWFGPTEPLQYHGVSKTPLHDPGATIEDKPQGLDYAFQKVQEWKGVPSAKAL